MAFPHMNATIILYSEPVIPCPQNLSGHGMSIGMCTKGSVCTSSSICSASLAYSHQSNTMSWFLLYKIFPLRRKPAINLHNILLSLSEASGGYFLSSMYHLISNYQALSSSTSSIIWPIPFFRIRHAILAHTPSTHLILSCIG